MPINYEKAVSKLMEALPFVKSVVIIEGRADVAYSTENWDIKTDIGKIISIWSSMKAQNITISGIKFLMRHYSSDRLVATSLKEEGHIVGVKDDERKIIAHIEPDGIIPFTTMEMARLLASLRPKEPYLDKSTQLGKKAQMTGDPISTGRYTSVQKDLVQDHPNIDVSFTSRLMAYYRALESKRDVPLIIDPFAERLAGDMTSFLNQHIRYSEMDYPIVRSYYIEEKLLKPWCNINTKSQIVLLGAGLDSRAYRFKPLQTNYHIIFEIDLAEVNHYKEDILQGEKALCEFVRLSADLSNLDWVSQLIKSGFSSNIPTFWVLEGLVYYMEQKVVASLLTKIAEISAENSQIFVDMMHASRWFPFPYTVNEIIKDPFSKHFKWGFNIKAVPKFFAEAGWNVSCSFADDHDQGRNVGQKGMLFIHGVRATTI